MNLFILYRSNKKKEIAQMSDTKTGKKQKNLYNPSTSIFILILRIFFRMCKS